ncbi:hypothetical protein [Fulvivirga sp.]|uniref:hypothetical protein n=1 Tax=Fulvivirga sp. TaxID=1931237 RepID=UPI0032F00F3C
MAAPKRFKYINSTLKFSIAGFFLPAAGAILFLVLQLGLLALGMECSLAIKALWTMTSFGLVITPIIFIRSLLQKLGEGKQLRSNKLFIFNIFQYFFIQCSLTSLFTSSQTLCYVTDGQNGIEFAFTGWMAIPFLILLSLIFDRLTKQKL